MYLTTNKNKQTMKKVFVSIATVAILVFGSTTVSSCQKENINQMEQTSTKSLTANNSAEIVDGLSYNDVMVECAMHNEYLDDIFDIFNFGASNYDDELNRCINALYLDADIDLSINSFNDLINLIHNSPNINNHGRVAELISALDERIFQNESFNYVANIIDSIQQIAISELIGTDKITVCGYAELLRNSAYYWMPTNWGGYGRGYEILSMVNGMNNRASETGKDKTVQEIVGEVAITDAAWMAGGCIATAIGGAINPALALPLLRQTVKIAAKKSARAALENQNS